jgi:hypothetical protein
MIGLAIVSGPEVGLQICLKAHILFRKHGKGIIRAGMYGHKSYSLRGAAAPLRIRFQANS